MKTLFIHIGYHKTATSSIQKYLADNETPLAVQGMNYAKTGRSGTSHAVLANGLKPENRNERKTEQLWSQLLKEIDHSPCPATLISSECFLEGKGIPAALAPWLRDKVRVYIICYLRPQLDWLESLYNEVVKDPYRRFTGDVFSLREVRLGWINYHEILDLWNSAFGAASLRVRSFERSRLKNLNIYDDLLDALGISQLAGASLSEDQNVSLHPSLTEFLRRCNTIPMLNPFHTQLVGGLQTINANGSVPLPHISKPVRRLTQRQFEILLPCIEECNVALTRDFAHNHQKFFESCEHTSIPSMDYEELLPPDLEHDIYTRLPSSLKSHFEQVSDAVISRKAGNHFLPLPAEDTEVRLRAVIIRQRIEARLLYSQLSHSTPNFTRHLLGRLKQILRR